MARFLLTWELGGGLGHLYPLSLLGRELVHRGHQVVAALRETGRAANIFQNTGVQFLPSPAKHRPSANRIDPPRSYAHVLHNIGFGEAGELAGHLHSWQTILDLARPDLVVVDHSPTALLALRGSGIPTVLYGIGFYCPPDQRPMVCVRPWETQDEPALQRHEDGLLDQVNSMLGATGRPQLPNLAKLFAEVTDNMLVTFPELDHFGPRNDAVYWGSLPSGSGHPSKWPRGEGHRIYAYLKGCPGVAQCLETLRQMGLPTLAVCEDLPQADLNRLNSGTLQVEPRPLNLDAVARECDLAITNASHGVTASILLAGKPVLQLPMFVEQFLIADRVARSGAGIIVPPGNVVAFEHGLQTMLRQNTFRQAAANFAERHSDHDPHTLVIRMTDRLEQLLP